MKSIIPLTTIIVLAIGLNSCNEDISGCTNPGATNYDELATLEDGSCILNSNTLLGLWNINTIENGVIIDDHVVNGYKTQLQNYGAAWFESYYQTQVPGNNEAWVNFASDQTTWIDTLSNSQYHFSEWFLTSPTDNLFGSIMYIVVNERKLLLNNASIGNYTSFDITYLTESDFILSSVYYDSDSYRHKTIDIHMSR